MYRCVFFNQFGSQRNNSCCFPRMGNFQAKKKRRTKAPNDALGTLPQAAQRLQIRLASERPWRFWFSRNINETKEPTSTSARTKKNYSNKDLTRRLATTTITTSTRRRTTAASNKRPTTTNRQPTTENQQQEQQQEQPATCRNLFPSGWNHKPHLLQVWRSIRDGSSSLSPWDKTWPILHRGALDHAWHRHRQTSTDAVKLSKDGVFFRLHEFQASFRWPGSCMFQGMSNCPILLLGITCLWDDQSPCRRVHWPSYLLLPGLHTWNVTLLTQLNSRNWKTEKSDIETGNWHWMWLLRNWNPWLQSLRTFFPGLSMSHPPTLETRCCTCHRCWQPPLRQRLELSKTDSKCWPSQLPPIGRATNLESAVASKQGIANLPRR